MKFKMPSFNSKSYKLLILLAIFIVLLASIGCSSKKEKVIIFTSLEDYRVEFMQKKLNERFPKYNIVIEYFTTGNHAAKLIAEGTFTDCDITYNLEYGYLDQLASYNVLAKLADYDFSIYTEDAFTSQYYIPQERNGGAIIVNMDVIKNKNLEIPKSYEDLLRLEYEGLISMPSPKSSGTGYMFLKSLVNVMGEDKAFEYFDKLTKNILQYTSSGSGPVNALVMEEVAIGLGMTAQTVTKINEGVNLEIFYFDEGSPYSMYGTGIISGKENKTPVKDVFDFLYKEFNADMCQTYYPEKIFKDKDFIVENYPTNINYADMSGDTIEEKEKLLGRWKY